MMKKHGKIAAILSVCILALAGCGKGETAETAADTGTAEITEAAEEQTSAETATAAETESETTASEETEDTSAEENLEGYYYECCFDDYIVAHSEEDFIGKGGTREMLDAAKAAVLETDNFKEAYAEMKDNPDGLYDWYFNDGSLLDKDGNFTAVFKEGFSGDFDGDGKNEAFVVYRSVGYTDWGASAAPYRDGEYAVYAGSDGAAEVVSYGYAGSCRAIRYNGFTHMLAEFGVNNSSTKAEIFALEDGRSVRKYDGSIIYGVTHGFLIEEIAPQSPGPWYIFWDNDAKEYRGVSNHGLDRGGAEDTVYVEIDLDTAAEKTVRLEAAKLTDKEITEMISERSSIFDEYISLSEMLKRADIDPNGTDIVFGADNFNIEIMRDDYDGSGSDVTFVKTVYPVYAENSPNAGTLNYSKLWAVTGRSCKGVHYFSSFKVQENKVFTVTVGKNKIVCCVGDPDTEKTYQSVECYAVFNGEVREVYACDGKKLVTDMTSLWLQSYTDENDVQPVQSVEEIFGEQERFENALNGRIELK